VVLAIIGMLVGLAVSHITSIYSSRTVSITQLFVQNSIKTPLMAYRLDNGDFPTTADGLQALLTMPAGKDATWKGPYLDTNTGLVPVDAWKHAYLYKYPGTHNPNGYDIWSLGPDGIDGNPDNIGNWPATATPTASAATP
jgi:general secretion pathway protein G